MTKEEMKNIDLMNDLLEDLKTYMIARGNYYKNYERIKNILKRGHVCEYEQLKNKVYSGDIYRISNCGHGTVKLLEDYIYFKEKGLIEEKNSRQI